MTDLLLQDLENLTNERLVHVLSYEKREMFGEQRVHAMSRTVDRSCSNPFADPAMRILNVRREKCYKVKS
jgi:hypothetical protein